MRRSNFSDREEREESNTEGDERGKALRMRKEQHGKGRWVAQKRVLREGHR
jgi:hypothetical protein